MTNSQSHGRGLKRVAPAHAGASSRASTALSVVRRQRVLILGGGYAGLYTALGLQRHQGETPLDIVVVDRNPYMTYQPLLPEVAGGHVAPTDVAISLRRTLKRSRIVRGSLASLDIESKTATVTVPGGSTLELDYDHVVFALG